MKTLTESEISTLKQNNYEVYVSSCGVTYVWENLGATRGKGWADELKRIEYYDQIQHLFA